MSDAVVQQSSSYLQQSELVDGGPIGQGANLREGVKTGVDPGGWDDTPGAGREMSVDRGYAWVVLAGCVVCQLVAASAWGTFGLFYVELTGSFPDQAGYVAWMWGVFTVMASLSGLVVGKLVDVFGCRVVTVGAAILAGAGLIICAFARNLLVIAVCYGVFIGTANVSLQLIGNVAAQQSFNKRRGLAGGLSNTGGTIGLLVFPPLFAYLITTYTWRGTYLIQAGIYLNTIVAAMFLPRRRSNQSNHKDVDMEGSSTSDYKQHRRRCAGVLLCIKHVRNCGKESLARNWRFILCVVGYFCQSFGHNIPVVYLVPRAVSYGISSDLAATLMSGWAISGIFGLLVIGWLGDRFGRVFMCGMSCAVSGVVTAAMCRFSSFPLLMTYAISYGFFSSGVFATYIPALVDVVGQDKIAVASGILFTPIGVGGLLAAQLADWLNKYTGSYHMTFVVGGGIIAAGGVTYFIVSVSLMCGKRTKKDMLHAGSNHPSYGSVQTCERTATRQDGNVTTYNKTSPQENDVSTIECLSST